jgi:hypothetical protein
MNKFIVVFLISSLRTLLSEDELASKLFDSIEFSFSELKENDSNYPI